MGFVGAGAANDAALTAGPAAPETKKSCGGKLEKFGSDRPFAVVVSVAVFGLK
jgi:hypothetical protein